MVNRILVVEDDPVIARLIVETLTKNGFAALAASSAREMDILLQQNHVDLVVLDIMLPGESGLSICHRLRETESSIIILTALSDDVDRIVGLEVGADDYITKPFNSRELVARIRAVLRRSRPPSASFIHRQGTITFDGWRLEPRQRELYNAGGAKVTMTSTEFELLLAFSRNTGRILSRDQLLEMTHSGIAGLMERSIDVHVSRLRQKLEVDPQAPSIIKTIRLGGYIFTPTVELA